MINVFVSSCLISFTVFYFLIGFMIASISWELRTKTKDNIKSIVKFITITFVWFPLLMLLVLLMTFSLLID